LLQVVGSVWVCGERNYSLQPAGKNFQECEGCTRRERDSGAKSASTLIPENLSVG
jgi:hypothetical protein